jgi:hypothetical protein
LSRQATERNEVFLPLFFLFSSFVFSFFSSFVFSSFVFSFFLPLFYMYFIPDVGCNMFRRILEGVGEAFTFSTTQ